ncbi:MAG: mycothiol system anti-sigma-R factor [Chloroflexota bacterium]|nr:mycothiol system anti-sigma-R factor [Chloroflexota bacterium]
MTNCRDCVQALNSYIDRELSDDDIVAVRGHLVECGGCLHLYQFEESVRRLVRLRCQEQSAPETLRTRITMTLVSERQRQERRRRPSGLRLE